MNIEEFTVPDVAYLNALYKGKWFEGSSLLIEVVANFNEVIAWFGGEGSYCNEGDDVAVIAKEVIDALVGVAFNDKDQVVSILVTKRYSEGSSIRIKIIDVS